MMMKEIFLLFIFISLVYSSPPSSVEFVGLSDQEGNFYLDQISLTDGTIEKSTLISQNIPASISQYVTVLSGNEDGTELTVLVMIEGEGRNQYWVEVGNVTNGVYSSITDNIPYTIFNDPLQSSWGYQPSSEMLICIAADYDDEAYLYFYDFNGLKFSGIPLKLSTPYPDVPTGVYDSINQTYIYLYLDYKTNIPQLVQYNLQSKTSTSPLSLSGDKLYTLNSTFLLINNNNLFLLQLYSETGNLVLSEIDSNSGTINSILSIPNLSGVEDTQYYYNQNLNPEYIVFITFPKSNNNNKQSTITTFNLITKTTYSSVSIKKTFPFQTPISGGGWLLP